MRNVDLDIIKDYAVSRNFNEGRSLGEGRLWGLMPFIRIDFKLNVKKHIG